MSTLTDTPPPPPPPAAPTRAGRPGRARRAAPEPKPERTRRAGLRVAAGRLVAGPRRALAWLGDRLRVLAGAVARPLRPIWTRVARFLEPLTSGGRVALALAFAALAGAWLLGWVELAAIGLVLLVAVGVGVLLVLGRPKFEVTLNLANTRVVVGDRAVGELKVRNVAERSAAPSLIDLPVGPVTASFPFPRLAAGAEHEELFTIPTQRRAVLRLGPVRSVKQDPLELLRRHLDWTDAEDIYVHPRTVRLENTSTGYLRDLEGLATREISNDDVAFHALREYVPGDDLRHVHWRSTARTSKLMIRQFEETRRSQFVIVVCTSPSQYADVDEFELGISIAASLALNAHWEGKDVTVYTSDAELLAPTPQRLLDAFSAIEDSRSRVPFPDRAKVVATDQPGASVVALVTGSGTPIADLRLASLRVPRSARSYAIRAAVTEELGRKAVGQLNVVTLSTLEELRPAAKVVLA